MELSAMPWLFAVLGGAVVLGLVLVYGMVKSKRATRLQRKSAEEGARELYHKDESKS